MLCRLLCRDNLLEMWLVFSNFEGLGWPVLSTDGAKQHQLGGEKMSLFRKLKQRSNTTRSRKRLRKLSLECLENREVFASGVVNVLLAPFAPPGTALALVGDGSNNDVSISQTLNVGEYLVQGKNGTLLKLNGAGATMPSITVNGINTTISVAMGTGNDTFSFGARPDSQPSSIPTDLSISNDDGSNVNMLTDVLINGNLFVIKGAAATGYNELQILRSTVVGNTVVDNVGAGGDSKTVIDTSLLVGSAGTPALRIENGVGADINNIRGNSQFGLGPFASPIPVVLIDNGDGGSQTTFTGASAIAGFGTTTVYGTLQIDNGLNLPGFIDLVTFDGTNVLGPVNVSNGDGNASTGVTNSTLGSHLALTAANVPLIGGPLVVHNQAGFDDFTMTGSTLPWGLSIDNDFAVPTSNWGSSTQISQSFVGTGPYGPRIGSAGDAMSLEGDNGRDLVNIVGTTLGGRLSLQLFAGNNELNVTNNSVMTGLYFVALAGNDKILIDKSRILVDVYVRMGNGADEFYLRNVTLATDWPSSLLGTVSVDGELGVDRTNLSSLIPVGFELLVP